MATREPSVLLGVLLLFGLTTGGPIIPNRDQLDSVQISFSRSKSLSSLDMNWNNSSSCKNYALHVWDTISMSYSSSLFQLINSVRKLLEQEPLTIGLSGRCHSISVAYYILDTKGVFKLDSYKEPTGETPQMCCVIFSSRASKKACGPKADRKLSPYEGLDHVLTDTFKLLSWKSTCVIYDHGRSGGMQVAIQSLHAVGVKYIVRRIEHVSFLNNTILDCMGFQTQHPPTFVAVFSDNVLRGISSWMKTLSRDIQGFDLVSQWLIWTDNVANFDLEGLPLNTAILEERQAYPLGGAQYHILSNVGNLKRSHFITSVEWNAEYSAIYFCDIFPNRGYGFNGITFTITTKEWPPFTIKDDSTNGEVTYSGLCIMMLDELGLRLNFSYKLVEPSDNEWGRLDNGRWTGMMQQLVTKQADMMAAAISIQQEREDDVDFTYPFFYDYKGIIMKHDTSNLDDWDELIDPFQPVSLVLLLLSVPTMAALLCVCENITPANQQDKRSDWPLDISPFKKFSHCLLYMYGALLCEGGEDTCKSLTGRTILAFWWLFALVVGGIYTGNLVASRTITAAAPVINTLTQLLEHPNYRWGIEQGDYLSMMFPTSNIDKYKAIWAGVERFNKTDPTVLSSNYSAHMAAVRRGNYAFFNDKSILAVEVSKDCENLVLATEQFLPMQFAIGLHQFSLYRLQLSKEIMAFHEAGIISAWKRRWWPDTDCSIGKTNLAQSIVLYEIRGAYYILVVSLVFSLLVLLSEIFLQKFIFSRCKNPLGNSEDGNISFIGRWKYYVNRLKCCIKPTN